MAGDTEVLGVLLTLCCACVEEISVMLSLVFVLADGQDCSGWWEERHDLVGLRTEEPGSKRPDVWAWGQGLAAK